MKNTINIADLTCDYKLARDQFGIFSSTVLLEYITHASLTRSSHAWEGNKMVGSDWNYCELLHVYNMIQSCIAILFQTITFSVLQQKSLQMRKQFLNISMFLIPFYFQTEAVECNTNNTKCFERLSEIYWNLPSP